MTVGRKPRPTALKVLEGNRGSHPLPQREPEPEPGIRRAPNHLSPVAKTHWRRISRLLSEAGILTHVDAEALELLCEAFARYQDASASLQRKGLIIRSPKDGFPIQNPYLRIANEAFDQVRKLLVEFGMTPAARPRIQTAKDADKAKDPAARFF